MLNRATQLGTTARTAGMRTPRPPDPMQQYVTAAIKDDERRAHNIATAQALAAVPVTGPEATLLGRLGQTITVPRAETDRLLNIREPAALPAAYVPDQAHENSISVLKVLKLHAGPLQPSCVPNMRQQVYQQRALQRKPSGPPETSQQAWDRRQVSVADTSATTYTTGWKHWCNMCREYQMDPFLQRQPDMAGRNQPAVPIPFNIAAILHYIAYLAERGGTESHQLKATTMHR